MQDVELSDEFCRFLQGTIPAVDAAELLLVFHGRPEAWLGVQDAIGKLGPGISRGDVEKYLEGFVAKELLESAEGKYRYRSDSPSAAHVETLSQAYLQRPVTLIRVIYALRDTKIQTFADAFKLRKS
jgi:hypothetical protein